MWIINVIMIYNNSIKYICMKQVIDLHNNIMIVQKILEANVIYLHKITLVNLEYNVDAHYYNNKTNFQLI